MGRAGPREELEPLEVVDVAGRGALRGADEQGSHDQGRSPGPTPWGRLWQGLSDTGKDRYLSQRFDPLLAAEDLVHFSLREAVPCHHGAARWRSLDPPTGLAQVTQAGRGAPRERPGSHFDRLAPPTPGPAVTSTALPSPHSYFFNAALNFYLLTLSCRPEPGVGRPDPRRGRKADTPPPPSPAQAARVGREPQQPTAAAWPGVASTSVPDQHQLQPGPGYA